MLLHQICQLNISELNELEALIRKLPIEQYTRHLSTTCSPVGAQVRHVIEFYQCFLQGLEPGTLDYDNRPRNPDLETSPQKALEQLKMIRRKLDFLDNDVEVLNFKACGGPDYFFTTTSNIERELLFLQSHTSHHKAIISLLLEQTDIRLPKEFGYALATKVYKQGTKTSTD